MTGLVTAILCLLGIPSFVVLFALACGWAQGDFLPRSSEAEKSA